MALPNEHPLVIEQGKTFQLWFAVAMPDGAIADLVALGYTSARMQVRPVLPDGTYGDVALELSTANGRIQLLSGEAMWDAPPEDPDRMRWSGYLWVGATTTQNLAPWGTGVYDLEVTKAGNADDVIPILSDTAVLKTEVTR